MERHTRLSRAAVVLVAIALIASIAAAVWFASPDAPYVPSEDSGAALGTAAPAEDGTVANQQTTVPSGYTGIYNETDFNNEVRGGNGNFILMSDITLTTLETSRSFAGILDGNGHTITIAAPNVAEGEGDSGGLFATLTTGNAEIKNLKIEVNQFMISTNQTKGSVGIIAAWVSSNVTIDNVYIELKYSPDTMRIGNGENGKSNAYLFARQELGKDASLWLGGVLAKVEGEGNTVTIKNTTVNNQTTGSYGFSTNVWTVGGWGLDHTDSFTQIGGFVAAVVKGTLNITNCKYEGEGKMTVTAESTDSSRYNAARIGGAVGQVEGGTLKVNGFIFESRGTRDSLFGTAGSNNTNYSDESGRGLIIGKGNPSTLTNLYINGETDPGHGFSNNDSATHDSKLIGDNTYWGGMLQYPSEFIDAEFDGSNVVFAVGKKEPTASDIVYQVKLRETATDQDYTGIDQSTFTVSDSEIADSIAQNSDEIGQAAWITLGTITRNNASYDYELTVSSRAAQSAYNVQNYDTVSSADDSAYRGSKVYDGTPVTTPTLNVGGTTVNAWTADSTTEDVGTKTFGYNASALSGYAAAAYNGGTYLVKDGTIYSPGTIIVNGVGQTFALGKDFVYEIAKAPVTVTPKVPIDDLYTGNPMPEITATAVDSGGSPVEGKIAWDDPDATLISGTHSYAWTWTPTSSNYQTVKDSMELEAFDRKIESLSVQGDFKKAYTAYEPFDPAGIVVTATYSDGSSAPLSNDEYEFTVMNGDKNRLIVGNDTVTVSLKKGSGASTTITISVSKLAVDVPIANQDLVYNGAEQIGVAASVDGYYSLSDNTGTNAAAYTATAELKDKVNTRWDTDTEDDTADKSIAWSIAKENVAITVMHTSKTYDGQVVEPKTLFNAQGVNDEALALTVAVDGGKTILGAGTYSVTASLAESVTNYTADSVTITYTVNKKGIQKPIDSVTPYTYNGTEQVVTIAENADYTVNGTTKATDAGNYSLTIALADKANTEWEGGSSDDITVTWSIIPMTIAGTVSAPTDLTYDGNAKEATFKLTSGELFNGDAVTIEYSGDNVNVSDGAITATANLPSDNYAWADDTAPSATFTISPKEITVTATSGSREFNWNSCSEEELRALFTLSEAVDYKLFVNDAEAEIADGQVSAIYDAKEYKIEIASANANYTLVGTTSTTYTITVKKVEKPIISDVREFIYNGGEQGFEIAENQAYEVVGDTKATDAYDGYIFTIRLVSPGNVAWSDDSPGDITVEWKINNATFTSVTIEFADGALDNLFTSSAMPTPTTITANPTPLPADVEGKFEWVESSLSEDTNTYHWTYTVPNYNVFEGTQELTAQAAVLESITLSGEYKTEYTAYDFFDIDNLVVTAHFSHGENQPGEDTPLALGEYTLTTASAQYDENGVPQLFVADDYVTVTYQGKSVQIDIKVAPKQIADPTVATGLVYDGTAKVGVTGGDGYTLSGDTTATNAGDYVATATLTDKANTVWEDGITDEKTFEWSIAKMVVSGEIVAPESLVYDGSQKAVSFDGQLSGNDEFGIAYDGDRQNVTADGFTVTVSLPNGNNYEWADGVVTTAAYKIEPKAVEIESTQELTKTYDRQAVDPDALFTAPNGVNNEGALQLAFVITVDGENRDEILNAGTYSVTASLAESVTNYTAVPVTITFTIAKATLTVTASTESEGLDTSDDLYAVPLNVKGVGVNGEEVSGTGVWASGQSLSEGTNNYKFVFTPDQEFAVNYEVYEGECEIANVAQATLTGVSVEIVATTEYVAFDAFDRSSIAVEALYGEDRKQVTDYTLTFSSGAEDRLVAGEITVTVSYGDGGASFEENFVIVVAKLVVEKPVVGDTTFEDNGGQITLEIAPSEFYTVTGNTGFGVGSYQATVSLVDADNTVWADGSVDDVSIAWTITEPVTSDEVIADILAMEKVTWQNAEEFLDLEARYNALDESEQTAEATAKLATLKAQYDALRNAAFGDIEAAHEVTAKSLGRALAAAAAGLSAAAIALAIAKRRSI